MSTSPPARYQPPPPPPLVKDCSVSFPSFHRHSITFLCAILCVLRVLCVLCVRWLHCRPPRSFSLFLTHTLSLFSRSRCFAPDDIQAGIPLRCYNPHTHTHTHTPSLKEVVFSHCEFYFIATASQSQIPTNLPISSGSTPPVIDSLARPSTFVPPCDIKVAQVQPRLNHRVTPSTLHTIPTQTSYRRKHCHPDHICSSVSVCDILPSLSATVSGVRCEVCWLQYLPHSPY
ncbi:hypothetical protein K504DRAFT_43461 [Pleomassaria siparia CBS 279.74]|uniref:Uncharacterized protein n=1 Tax=Pleomassaria siparia CBS 279.74 TaxID=1314801 RepID=A0A6G1K4T8_9PLEO|nr:hypothetical protein K504DRAFT_43461 [Pleomassaria siparia CBS 279.74]